MNTLNATFPPRAPRPSYPYQHPHAYDAMFSSSPSTTPSLVARSLASTPSTSLPDEEHGLGYVHDHAQILYATGLDSLHHDESKRWTLRSNDDEPLPGHSKMPRSPTATHRNHIATPYIPTVVRRRAAADPVQCGIGSQQSWQPHRKWIKSFRAGSVSRLASVRRHCAREIVEAGPWDTATMSELTARFIERAAEGCSEDLAFVAPLASEVHRAFLHIEGDSAAQSFVELLKQHLLSEFRAWWLASLQSSVRNIPKCSPSPPHSPPHRHVSCALSVATFVGDLFGESLVSGSFVMLCLNMILETLSVAEEVEALHLIVSHAGEHLYDRVPLSDFVANLQARTALFEPDVSISVLRKDPTAALDEVRYHVDGIAHLVHTWSAARSTPTPSEFSETATEYSDDNPEFTVHRPAPPGLAPPQIRIEDTTSYGASPEGQPVSHEQDSIHAPPTSSRLWADVVKA